MNLIGRNHDTSVPLLSLSSTTPYDLTTKTSLIDLTLPQFFTNFGKTFFMWSLNVFAWLLQGSGNLIFLLFSVSEGENFHSFAVEDSWYEDGYFRYHQEFLGNIVFDLLTRLWDILFFCYSRSRFSSWVWFLSKESEGIGV